MSFDEILDLTVGHFFKIEHSPNQGKPKQKGNLYAQSKTPFCTYIRLNLQFCSSTGQITGHDLDISERTYS